MGLHIICGHYIKPRNNGQGISALVFIWPHLYSTVNWYGCKEQATPPCQVRITVLHPVQPLQRLMFELTNGLLCKYIHVKSCKASLMARHSFQPMNKTLPVATIWSSKWQLGIHFIVGIGTVCVCWRRGKANCMHSWCYMVR